VKAIRADEKRRVALFGGSFNPPHMGHVLGAVYALSTAPVDEVLVVPVYQHPFAKHLAPFTERMAMLRLALGWIPRVRVSSVEEELGGESRTLRTIEHLTQAEPGFSLRLLVGADVIADLPKWHRWDRIAALAPPLVLGRAGVEVSDAERGSFAWVGGADGADGAPASAGPSPPPVLPRVSSTEIRDALAAGDVAWVRGLVPTPVLDHILARGLYGTQSTQSTQRTPREAPRG
jgi:nicotinate-nucleotide adenylyltransferase